MVKEAEAPMDPFGPGNVWAVGVMGPTLIKINSVLTELRLGTINTPSDDKVRSYAFAFHQFAEALEKLSANLKAHMK